MRIFFKLLMIALIGLGVFWLFSFVLPQGVAGILGFAAAAVLAVTAAAGKMSGRAFFAIGPVFLVWPVGAILAGQIGEYLGQDFDRAQALAWAWPLPVLAYFAHFALARSKDAARDLGAIILAGIILYSALYAVAVGQYAALGGLGLGAAVAVAVVGHHFLLPDENRRDIAVAAAVAGAAGILALVRSGLA